MNGEDIFSLRKGVMVKICRRRIFPNGQQYHPLQNRAKNSKSAHAKTVKSGANVKLLRWSVQSYAAAIVNVDSFDFSYRPTRIIVCLR